MNDLSARSRFVRSLFTSCLLLGTSLLSASCVSTTGPFISELQRDARGNLVITECDLEMAHFGDGFHQAELVNCTDYVLLMQPVNASGAWAPKKVKPPRAEASAQGAEATPSTPDAQSGSALNE